MYIEEPLVHWEGNIILIKFLSLPELEFVILMKFLLLTSLEVVIEQLPVQPIMKILSKWYHFYFCIVIEIHSINLVVDCCHSNHVYNFCATWLLRFRGFLLVDGEVTEGTLCLCGASVMKGKRVAFSLWPVRQNYKIYKTKLPLFF